MSYSAASFSMRDQNFDDDVDIFDFSKPLKPIYLPGGQTEGHVIPDDSDIVPDIEERPVQGQEYAEKYRQKELDLLQRGEYEEERQKMLYGHGSSLGDIEVSSAGTFPDVNELNKDEYTDVYKNYYQKRPKPQQNLTISEFRKKILASVESNEVTIIKGPTGCGKTTQVPQYILDSYAEKNQHCNIVVTQPRRIAAISIAERVCKERDWPVGTLCGYQVGQKEKISEDTRLTYMTVGLFLNQIVNSKDLTRYTHVILDEIHERNLDTDFALLVVKKLINTNSRHVKIILMSATVDSARFSAYFQKVVAGKFIKAPVVEIKKPRSYSVQVHYLHELSSLGDLPRIEYDDPGISEEAYNICIKLIKQFEKIDSDPKYKKSVLVFLPGINEIEEMHKRLTDPKIHSPSESMKYNWHSLPLHSTITHQEQADAFKPPSTGHRKIILATNIAESSITVPDIKFVIDFCLTKVLVTDLGSNFTSLQLCWTSKVNCTQRAGRVGRVMDGRVYRMVLKEFYENYLEEEAVPDMLRCPLEKVVLQSKQLQMGEPKAILALALDPPNLSDIERTILVLKEAGGLLLTSGGVYTPHDGDLTYLGLLMAQLPLDIRLTRLIVMGYLFSVFPECVIMAAAMSLKSVFSNPFKEKMLSYNSKLEWADASCSDCIAFLNVFQIYKENIEGGFFQRSKGDSEDQWAKRYFIQIRQLREVMTLVLDITRRLKTNQIEEGPTPNGSPITYNEFEKALILKLVIAGAFYPNYFGRGGRGGQVDEPSAVKTIGGRDPFTTIYFNGYPPEQPPHLYSELIRQELRDCKEDMRISYDGSCKVYVEFRRSDTINQSDLGYDDRIPGKISMAVYRAVKLRQIRRYIEIRVMRPDDAQTRAAKLGISKSREMYLNELRTDDKNYDTEDMESCSSGPASSVKSFASNLPGIDVSFLNINIPHYIDAGHFWAVHADHRSQKYQETIFGKLNAPDAKLRRFTKMPELGDLCVAPWAADKDDGECRYRARIDAIYNREKTTKVKVFFIDYGNTAIVDLNKLEDYTQELYSDIAQYQMQAFECVLTGLAPSTVTNKNGNWSEDANKYFIAKTSNCELYGNIYSVVNGVVSLELYKMDKNKQQISINKLLLDKGFADPVEESFLSKQNHEIREQRQMDPNARVAYNNLQESESWSGQKYDPPDRRDCKTTLQLRGPTSPLEMKIFSYARGALCKEVKVAQDSVNSVLLDSDPQDPHERLIVSAHVSQNQSNTTLILHQTTIMPNIHGLAALIPFIFAPRVELRVNEAKTKYIGLICGLGVDQNGRPMFPEHDMEIPFDVEFTFDDFVNVNRLRYLMDQLLHTDENEKYPSLHWNDTNQLQKKIKKIVLELVCQRRKSQEIQFSKKQHMWGLTDANCYIQNKNFMESNKRSIFPFHPGIQIQPESEEIVQLRNHNEELLRIARAGVERYAAIECELCNATLQTIAALRIHLNTAEHKDNEVALLNDTE